MKFTTALLFRGNAVRSLIFFASFALVTAVALEGVFASSAERGISARTPGGAISLHAAGRGRPFLNLEDGREMSVTYRGERSAVAALQSGEARSLASADFDSNGVPDVVAGFSAGGAGTITVQRGNPDAFAPADDSVFVRMQQGYNPDSLLPGADVYSVPASPDFLVTGNFTHDSEKDVLFASKGGALYLMAGDGSGRLSDPQPIDLPGPVTALGAGEFRAADGFTDVAVGVSGTNGESLVILEGVDGLSSVLAEYALLSAPIGIEFGGLDDDPYQDIAVAAGSELLVVHGWGRREPVAAALRGERIVVGTRIRGLALGEFAWDRQGRTEIAALTDDGTVQIVQDANLDTRPFSEAEAALRTRANLKPETGSRNVDVESMAGWRPGSSANWAKAATFAASRSAGLSTSSTRPLLRTNLSYREIDDLIFMAGGSSSTLEIMRPMAPSEQHLDEVSAALSGDGLVRTTLDAESAPVAVLVLPRKLNGVTDMVMLNAAGTGLTIVPNAPNTTITVDRTDDPGGGSLAGVSACTAAGSDCSLRGALQFANNPANNNTTISLPANTYILTVNGTSAGGCDGNTVGDLGANQTMSIVGAGAATTIIRQTATGPANDGDRIMCMNEPFTLNLVYNFSGVTFVGGREGTAAGTGTVLGGAGIIGGEFNNSLTMTNVVMANNQETVAGSANAGGGGLQITGGNLIITNSTFGGTNAPGAYTDRSSTTTGNTQAGSGGGIMFTPSSPMHSGGTGTLTVTGTTFSRNTSTGIGGGGADLLIFAFASPGGIGSGSASIGTSTFSNNSAANGGGIIVESLPTTVATTSLTNNSATNRGGGIYVGGASLLLNGTTPSITFTGNTAPSGGTSVSTASAVTVSGTNTTIGGSIEVSTLGSWTNNAGSTLNPTDVVVTGGTFNMSNSTMNVSGNMTIGPGPVVGSTFNGNSGTINTQGNLIVNAGGAPATSFNGGTGTFNFNGTSAQSITNGTSITFFNLTDSNITNPLTLNNSLVVNNTLNVNGVNAILSPVAGAVISGTGTLTGSGTARVSRIAATADFLSQYTLTNKTLTNLTIDYNGSTNQSVNNTPSYSQLRISGAGTKTLQGSTVITGSLTIVSGSAFASGNNNFALGGNWINGVGAAGFVPGTGTVTFQAATGTQLLTGDTTFYNLTLNNAGAITSFGSTTTTIGNDLIAAAGTMDGSTSTIIFTGVTDNAGAIGGAAAKNFFNLQVNSPATISHTAGGNITIENNYTNAGAFSQAAGLTTIFDVDNLADGAHALSGAGTTTFGNFTVSPSNTVDAGTHNFRVVGGAFTSAGTFTGNASTVTFNGSTAQSITGDGVKNFSGLLLNNANGVSVINGAQTVDAAALGLLTLNTDLTVNAGAILQQNGTSTGAADVIGTVRRTDLSGAATRSFGNVNNQVTITSGTAPSSLDFSLVKSAPAVFPAGVKVVPRTYALTPTGGSGIAATVRLRYVDPGELSGITESRLLLWKDTTGSNNWVAQGGTVDTAGNHVTHTGISGFSSWAVAEGADMTLSKANNVSNSAVVGQPWNWTLTAANTGSPATFTSGQTILTDNLPNSNVLYGAPTVQNVSNITGSANISCAIVSNDLTCVANGGSVTFASNVGASNFDVVFSATAQVAGSYQNPRTGGGLAKIDPNTLIAESNETNNSPSNNTVTVGKAGTTTTINSDNPDPSVVGQPVTVTWSVTVNAPGAVGTALTGNVTVSDGTNQCVAAVSAGQCDVTFTSTGAKSVTATYAGDTNYNGSASTPATAHTVNKADTTTTITSDNPDTSNLGQSVTVQWSVPVAAPGAGTPTGNVNVTVSGGAETCSAAVGSGQCSLALNGAGVRTITASYVGDANYNASSDTESHQVCGTTLVTTVADSGAGSLRQIVADACAGATITFDTAGVFATPKTISLTTGEILIGRSMTIKGSDAQVTVSGNNASRVWHVNTGTTVALVGLTVSGGSTTGDGAAILNDGALTVVNSTLSGNAAATDGGAISTTAAGTALTLINTTISGNTAGGSGGGLITLGGTVSIVNTTITNNTADFDNNSAGTGGGLRVQAGTVTLKNTIVAGNINENGVTDAADDISGTVDAAGSFNLVGTGGAGGLTNGVNNNQVGVASAGLAPLADNGGRTQTHALLPASPAIEGGSNASLPQDTFDVDGDAITAETLPVDQRGRVLPSTIFPRVADSADAGVVQTVDIGAFEAHPTVEDVQNQTTNEDTVKNVTFNLGDDTASLISGVTATSSNTTLVPNNVANLSFTGSAGSRTLQITPVASLSGTTTITLTVTATNGRTATDTFDLTVNAVNDPPSGANNTVTTAEDTAYVFAAADFGFSDPGDAPPNTLLAVKITTLPGLGTLTNNDVPISTGDFVPVASITGGLFKFAPAADGFGTPYTSFTFQVQDNGGGTALDPTPNTMTVNVTAVNDAPSFTLPVDRSTAAQNAGLRTILNFATSISQGPNETGQVLTFTISPTGTTGTLTFSTPPAINATTGTLTYAATNGTYGTATFDVTLSDNAGGSNTSAPQSITIVTFKTRSPLVDLNGDGNGDAFLYNAQTGNWSRQISQAGGGFVEQSQGSWDPGWSVTPAYFDDDDVTDFFLFNTTSGQWFKMLTGPTSFTTQATGFWWQGWERYAMELDGDGFSDLFVYDPVSGAWFKSISTSTGFDYVQGQWNSGWEIYPVRFNTDAYGDMFLISRQTGRWFWVLGQTGAGFTYPATDVWFPGWQISPGDLSGDGVADLLLYDPPTGIYFAALANGAGFTYLQGTWTLGWKVYVMDLNGDGRDDLFLHDPLTGVWFEMLGDGAGNFAVAGTQTWSLGWNLHPTDLNADTRADIVLYDPTTGAWYQARNLINGSFTYNGGTWTTGLTVVTRTPIR
jgi:predicted outer membrane repeat protein